MSTRKVVAVSLASLLGLIVLGIAAVVAALIFDNEYSAAGYADPDYHPLGRDHDGIDDMHL